MLALDKEYTISEIVVFNRRDIYDGDNFGTRLNFFRLTVFRNGVEVFTYNDNASPAALVTSIPMTSKVIGDTVKIQLFGPDRVLSLAEVEVYGGDVLPTAFPSSVPSDIPSSIPSVAGPQPLITADVSDFTFESFGDSNYVTDASMVSNDDGPFKFSMRAPGSEGWSKFAFWSTEITSNHFEVILYSADGFNVWNGSPWNIWGPMIASTENANIFSFTGNTSRNSGSAMTTFQHNTPTENWHGNMNDGGPKGNWLKLERIGNRVKGYWRHPWTTEEDGWSEWPENNDNRSLITLPETVKVGIILSRNTQVAPTTYTEVTINHFQVNYL
jgi:hypothetical protein